jgi:subtilisin family serine protease
MFQEHLDHIHHIEEDSPMWISDQLSDQVFNREQLLTYDQWGLDDLDGKDDDVYAYGSTGLGVDVYVIDSGVFPNEDISQNIKKSRGVDLVGNKDPTNDCTGHGTHVSSTIAGLKYGVAKGANLIPVKIFDCNKFTYNSLVISALSWVNKKIKNNDKAVINMSLGGSLSQALLDAIKQVANKAVVVVAAGNNNMDACYSSPANSPDVVSVGAYNKYHRFTSFSNYGRCVGIYAPGEVIKGALNKNTGSTFMSGTSMASPHVAGIAALIYENVEPGVNSIGNIKKAIYKNGQKNVIDFNDPDIAKQSVNLCARVPLTSGPGPGPGPDPSRKPSTKPSREPSRDNRPSSSRRPSLRPSSRPSKYFDGPTGMPTLFVIKKDCTKNKKMKCRSIDECMWSNKFGCFSVQECEFRNKKRCNKHCRWSRHKKCVLRLAQHV